jgi:hypothetical protein
MNTRMFLNRIFTGILAVIGILHWRLIKAGIRLGFVAQVPNPNCVWLQKVSGVWFVRIRGEWTLLDMDRTPPSAGYGTEFDDIEGKWVRNRR